MTAFGPVFSDGKYASPSQENGRAWDRNSDEVAAAFLKWLPRDAREYDDGDLMEKYAQFIGHAEAGLIEWDD
jgi:hypothetical protein